MHCARKWVRRYRSGDDGERGAGKRVIGIAIDDRAAALRRRALGREGQNGYRSRDGRSRSLSFNGIAVERLLTETAPPTTRPCTPSPAARLRCVTSARAHR